MYFVRLYFILICLFSIVNGSDFYRTLLYGDQFKGFLKITPLQDDEVAVDFDVLHSELSDIRWSIHVASAPYDMAVMTDNCKRVKKSPHLIRDQLVGNTTTLKSSVLMGNTIVVGTRNEVIACATVIIPGQPLLSAFFHADPIEGHVHIIPMDNMIRILPDLRYMTKYEDYEPSKAILTWALVPSCEAFNKTEFQTDGSELGVDARTTISFSISNYTLHSLLILRQYEPFSCADLQYVEPRIVLAVNHGFKQQNYYEAVQAITEDPPQTLRIRDDCLDLATETVHERFQNFYPSINIFGSDNIVLRSLDDGLCTVLRPQFPRPAVTAYFLHPINGRLTIVDTEENVLLTGELRHVFETTSARASIMVSERPTGTTGCDADVECEDCMTVQDAAIIVGKDDDTVTLSGRFSWFNISKMQSVVIDLEWTKACANLTFLPNGAISAHALFKKVTHMSSSTVASIVALEYPANNYTEVLINKRQPFSLAEAHSRPIDFSITSGPPCGEQNLGPVKHVFWTPRLSSILASDLNDTSVFIWFNMVTGIHSVLGTSVLLTNDKQVYCGDFEPLTENTRAVAVLPLPLKGFVRLTQYSSSNWASGLPTEVYYHIERNITQRIGKEEEFSWEIVAEKNNCANAVLFNPFKVNETECSPEQKYLCPLGNATAKSDILRAGARNHMVAYDFPLTGPFSVVGKSLRLRSLRTKETLCADIVEFKEATFRWVGYSNRTLASIQKEFATKSQVNPFQVQVDYTREHFQSKCSIYHISVSAPEEKLAEILDSFDVEKRKFANDTSVPCENMTVSTTSPPQSGMERIRLYAALIIVICCVIVN